MAVTGPFIDRANQFDNIQGYQLNRVVDFLNGITDYTLAMNLPAGQRATIPPTNYGTIPLKFDQKSPSGVSSVTFSIPSGFTGLQFRGVVRCDAATQFSDIYIQFNGDTGANYTWMQLFGNNNTPTSSTTTTATAQPSIIRSPAATATSGNASSFVVDIENYSGTTFTKDAIATSFSPELISATGMWLIGRAVHWTGTGAITSVTFAPLTGGGNFVTGSVFGGYVYP